MRAMRNVLTFLLALGAAPAAAGAFTAAPRVAVPLIPAGALARPTLGSSLGVTPSLRLAAPQLAPPPAPALAPALAAAPSLLPAPSFAAAPAAAAEAPGAQA